MKKILSIIIGFVLCMAGTSIISAQNLDIDAKTRNIVIRGTVPDAQLGADSVSIKVTDNVGALVYMNEAKIVSGRYFSKFKFNGNDISDYTVHVYNGEDITDYALVEIEHSNMFSTKISVINDGTNTWFEAGDVIDLKAEIVNLYKDETDLTVYFAGYDSNDKLTEVKMCDKNIDFGYDGQAVDIELKDFITASDLSYIKAYVWQSDNQSPQSVTYKRETGESTYQDGDVIALIGDSITEVSSYVSGDINIAPYGVRILKR